MKLCISESDHVLLNVPPVLTSIGCTVYYYTTDKDYTYLDAYFGMGHVRDRIKGSDEVRRLFFTFYQEEMFTLYGSWYQVVELLYIIPLLTTALHSVHFVLALYTYLSYIHCTLVFLSEVGSMPDCFIPISVLKCVYAWRLVLDSIVRSV